MIVEMFVLIEIVMKSFPTDFLSKYWDIIYLIHHNNKEN